MDRKRQSTAGVGASQSGGAGDECVQNPSVCAESWVHPSGWIPSGCGGPAARANASSLVDDVWEDVVTDSCRGHTPSV